MMMANWQGVRSVGGDLTTKVINAARTVCNDQKPAWNVGEYYFSGLVGTLKYHSGCVWLFENSLLSDMLIL